MTATPMLDIDLTDLDLFASGDIHRTFALLRRHRPVYWNDDEDGGFWALTRYQDVFDAYNDTARLSSRHGTVLGGSYRRKADSAGGQMLIASDSPAHRLLRQQVRAAFLPDMMERAGAVVRRYVATALDQVLADGHADFAEVALELPRGLVAVMFGLDRDEAMRLLTLTRSMIGFRDPRYRGTADESMALVAAQVEILDMMAVLVAKRRRTPGTDLVSTLVGARLNGRPMTESEILYNCLNVAVGGDETTPFTAAAAIEAFIEHPDQFDRLLSDPSLTETALREIFRWTSTNSYVQRTARTDLEIGGQRVTAGQSVTLWNVSANFDEAAFARPTRFDVGRGPNRHLAFGTGPHRCIGRGAAWLELKILLEELLERRMRFALDGPVRRLRSNFMFGPTSLPVRVEAHR